MFSVSFMGSEKFNDGRNHYKMTLKSLANTLGKCNKGVKTGSYFLRGALGTDKSGCILDRCDEHLEYSKLLIIDGDSGINGKPTPTVEECVEAVESMGYNYILYTTHSHKAEHNKYRVVIEMTEVIERHELRANMEQLLDEFKAQGVIFNPVKEMFTWSQPWFNPRRDDPSDGLFRCYAKFDGDDFKTLHVEYNYEITHEEEKDDNKSDFNIDELYNNIETGKEFHQSINNIIWQDVNDGVTRAKIIRNMQALMNGSKEAGTERWTERYKDIERSVDDAIEKVKQKSESSLRITDFDDLLESSDSVQYDSPMPLPPGRFGRLIDLIYNGMNRQSIEIAHISAFSAIAAICGARFNALSRGYIGLNMGYILVAGTGYGKSQVKNFLEHIFLNCMNGRLIEAGAIQSYSSFLFAGSVTSPIALHRNLQMSRSGVVLVAEAAHALLEKSGATDKLMGYMLNLQVDSGYDSYTTEEKRSNDEESLTALRGIAKTFVYESEPVTLAKALVERNLLENGFLPRNDVLTVHNRPKLNKIFYEHPYALIDSDDDIVDHIRRMLMIAKDIQAVKSGYQIVTLKLTTSQNDELIELDDYYGSEFIGQGVTGSMSTRIPVKIIKVASLVTILNNWNGEDLLNISDEAWEYSKEWYSWYMRNLHSSLSFASKGNIHDDLIMIVKKAIIQAAKKIKKAANGDSVVRLSDVKNVLNKNNGAMMGKIKNIAIAMHKSTEDGLEHAFKMLVKQNKIRMYEKHRDCKVPCIIIMKSFND